MLKNCKKNHFRESRPSPLLPCHPQLPSYPRKNIGLSSKRGRLIWIHGAIYLIVAKLNQTLGKPNKEIEVVPASHNSRSLIFLEMYTNYTISILAFNPAGEGPESEVVSVRTLQGIHFYRGQFFKKSQKLFWFNN